MPHFKKGGRGDEFVQVIVKTPKDLEPDQKKIFEELAKKGF